MESDSLEKIWVIPSGRQSTVEMLTKGKGNPEGAVYEGEADCHYSLGSTYGSVTPTLLLLSFYVGNMTPNHLEEESVLK